MDGDMTLTLPPEAYLWFKTLHIIGVVVWFAGLFYLVRLFIYHVEAERRSHLYARPSKPSTP
jgi:putative membrane protein